MEQVQTLQQKEDETKKLIEEVLEKLERDPDNEILKAELANLQDDLYIYQWDGFF